MTKKKTKYQTGARGQDCTLRFVGCRNNTETVVLCHLPGWLNKIVGVGVIGVALKSKDEDGVDACYHCHAILDHPPRTADKKAIAKAFVGGVNKTRLNRKDRGIS